jgi:hypothetical protein
MPPSKRLYVPDGSTNKVLVYSNTASGNAAPTWILFGASTALSTPSLVATDASNGDIYVANTPPGGSAYITVYSNSVFSVFPQGGVVNIAPNRSFSIPVFGDSLSSIEGMAVDSGHELVLAFSDSIHLSANGVYWFAANANGVAAPTFWPDPPGVGWTSVTTDLEGSRVFLADTEGHAVETYSNLQGVPASSASTICKWAPAPFGSTNYFQIAWGGMHRMLFLNSRWNPGSGLYWGEIQSVDPCSTPAGLFRDINAATAGGGATGLTTGGPIAVDATTDRVSATVFPSSTVDYTPHILSWPWTGSNGNIAPSWDLKGNCITCSGSMSYAYLPALFAYGP